MIKSILFIGLALIAFANTSLAFENGNIILNSNHGGDGSAWGQSQCSGCHILNFLHKGLPIQKIARDKGYQNCSGCHGNNGTQIERPCIVCHNSSDLADSPILSGAENHNFEVNKSSTLTDQQCLSCHNASNMNGVFEPAIDLTAFTDQSGIKQAYDKSYQFCLACHNLDHQQVGYEISGKDYRNPLVAMENNYHFIDMHGKPKGSGLRTYSGLVAGYQYKTIVECTDCHAMHGTHNTKLIIDESRKGAKQLQSNINYPIDVYQGDYSQLCVICHSMEQIVEDGALDTGNSLSGVHMTGNNSDCRECHTHGLAVQTGL